MLQNVNNKPGELKALATVFKAMLAGQLLFVGILFYLSYSGTVTAGLKHINKTLQIIAIAVYIASIYFSKSIFSKKLLQIRNSSADIKSKFAAYRSASLIQWAILEGSCLFIAGCFLVTANYAFLFLAAVMILLFAMLTPNKSKIAIQLQLSEEEIATL